jgi:DNA-binding beta-propeller fold protein YncE
MTARSRLSLLLLALVAIALAVLASGCGTTFKLPTEDTSKAVIAGEGTYQRIATWTGMTNIQDILLTPSGELYLLFQDDVAKTGTVKRYPQSSPNPLSTTFPGLQNPTALCFGANRIFVLDAGDSTLARTNQACLYTAEVEADVVRDTIPVGEFYRPIKNVSAYWHVREYLLDGTPAGAFSDTNFAWVSGIAADASGRVYVSGAIMYCDVSPWDSHTRTLEYRYRIRRYVHGTGDRFVVDGSWKRDASYVLLEGSGFGSTRDPRGMQWSSASGAALYFADFGNNQVQCYGDPINGASSYKLDFGGSGADSLLLSMPVDVAVDSAGYVYVADGGNQRVLRYQPDGARVLPWGRVDRTPDETTGYLVRPVAVAADNRQVYVADRGTGQVLRYWRRD